MRPWLPLAVPGQFDPGATSRNLAGIREEADRAGRDPDAIGAILRVNPAPAATVADIADAIRPGQDLAGQIIAKAKH